MIPIREKFGKPSGDVLRQMKSYAADNTKLRLLNKKMDDLYRRQPRRLGCKICGEPFGESYLTVSEIRYYICGVCGHITGEYEDTDAFNEFIYSQYAEEYASVYDVETQEKYNQRVQNIYVPKAKFLLENLGESHEQISLLKYCDFGAGAGCFLSALQSLGMEHVEGYDVEGTQAVFIPIRTFAIKDTLEIVRKLDCDVVSLIGVLEHLHNPNEILAELSRNLHVKYLYLSVPMFSPAVIFQMAFPHVFARHLSGGHTHLFSKSSLDWLFRRHSLDIIAEWWFGQDILDLYRSILVSAPQLEGLAMFAGLIDPLQMTLDTQKQSSEVHMLLKPRRDDG